MSASCLLGSLTYSWHAWLFHRPSVLMVSTGIPQTAAVVAAPIRKLCPAYSSGLRPALARTFLSAITRRWRVRASPDLNRNSGPSPGPRIAIYASMAATGQSGVSVLPMYIVTPYLNGSVFDCLMQTARILGFCGLSALMSAKDRCCPGSNSPSSGAVSSPDLRKPKKPRQLAAHSIMWSQSVGLRSHSLRMQE